MERTPEQIAGMSRRELARLQANEMSAALNPYPETPDDQIGASEKAAMQGSVAALVSEHRRELAVWNGAQG